MILSHESLGVPKPESLRGGLEGLGGLWQPCALYCSDNDEHVGQAGTVFIALLYHALMICIKMTHESIIQWHWTSPLFTSFLVCENTLWTVHCTPLQGKGCCFYVHLKHFYLWVQTVQDFHSNVEETLCTGTKITPPSQEDEKYPAPVRYPNSAEFR